MADESPSPGAPQRVSKLLAQRGVCSRREAERLIEAGHVRVDGAAVQLGAKVPPDADIEISPEGLDSLAAALTVALHKPAGIVSAMPEADQQEARSLLKAGAVYGSCDRATVARVVASAAQMAVAGRLDRASRGLLILTTDGVVARALIGGHGVVKSYLVTLDGDVSDGQLSRLNKPMRLDDRKLLPMKVTRAGRRRLRFELREGMKHQIRRCCGKVGLEVEDLFREAVGPVRLADLPPGKWRPLSPDEAMRLRQAAR